MALLASPSLFLNEMDKIPLQSAGLILSSTESMASKVMNISASSSRACSMILIFVIFVACYAEKRSLYLVLMEEEPVAFQGPRPGMKPQLDSEVLKVNAKHLVDSHDQLLGSTLEIGTYNKLYSFKHIVNGFSVHTTPSQAKKLKYAPGVKLVERDRGAKLMTTFTPQFVGLPERVWTQEGGEKKAGEGIVIGFVDTGINPTHPSFAYDALSPLTSNVSRFSGDCETGPRFPASSCNGKIVSARFFSAGAQAIATLNNSVDFLSPFDAVGHGSHVASIAAGNAGVPVVANGFYYGLASGMAPRARIAVYKAVYPTVGTMTDVVAAMDQATLDGVDILTLSVGPDEPPEDTPTFLSAYDVSMLFVQRAGVFVVQAAGNHGPGPSTVLSYSPWAVGVASCTTDRSYPSSITLGNGQKVGGVGLAGSTCGDGFFLHRLVLAQDAVKADGTFPRTPEYVEECQHPEALERKLVQGSIVICTFSSGFYNDRSNITVIIDTARALGFLGFALIANPNYGDFVAQPIPFTLSGIMIPKVSDSQVILEYYEQQNQRDERGSVIEFRARAAIGEGRVASFGGKAPVVSRFSSRGPDFADINKHPAADVLKPDILAPGNQIWAAWSPLSASVPILEGESFALLSGTSMATPHVAGIAALIKQYNPSWTPSMIASAMSTSATTYDNNGDVISAEGYDVNTLYPASHFDFGAGLVNPSRAINPGLVLSSEFKDYVKFLCSLPGVDGTSVRAAVGVWCNQKFNHPANLNLPSVTISALRGSLSVQRSFKNVGRRPETYMCSVLSPNGTIVKLSPTWFRIAPQETQVMDVQFNVTQEVGEFSFGQILLTGSLDHIVRIPLAVLPISSVALQS